MNPRLVAIDGPLKGEVFALTEDEVSLGREAGNGISLPDAAVSRRHCSVVRQEPGQFLVRDWGSRNATFVNGLPITERLLADGDEIRLGRSVFLFLMWEREREPGSGSVLLEAGNPETHTMVALRREDAVYLKAEDALAAAASAARTRRALGTLLRIGTAIHATLGVEGLALRLLELIGEVAPAERGAILLFERGGEEPAAAFGWHRATGPGGPVAVSSQTMERARREDVAILTRDLVGGEPRSLLVAPLFSRPVPLGVIYLDSADPEVSFDEDHLQIVTAIGVIAGAAMENAFDVERLRAENERLQTEINIEHEMVGESARMREVYRFIAKVAPTDSTVLICGESGTGKELAARAIHRNSPRTARPFVAINCATLTESLLESELFGHERGAFTGAVSQKRGRLEVADGGTVFLDEIGELPLPLQAKLLRVLQEREFERVGGTRPIRVDVRLLAATNRDLRAAIERGAFRQDLYYRLNVVALTIPPLRERREDIGLLASYFVAKHGRRAGRRVTGVSAEARGCLREYDWPGNVRELENAIERAVVLGSTELILREDLPEDLLEGAAAEEAEGGFHQAIKQEKKRLVLEAIERAGGNYAKAARLLEVHPTYLHKMIRNWNLRGAGRGE